MNIDLGTISAGVTFSPCKRYRYRLWRRWKENGKTILWIMLNPSTADHEVLDPTITRCLRFSQQWRFAAMVICNLFAYRATHPRQLLAACDPVGAENGEFIKRESAQAHKIILAWGNHGVHQNQSAVVLKYLQHKKLYALRINRTGEPAHPLYLPQTLKPQIYHTQ